MACRQTAIVWAAKAVQGARVCTSCGCCAGASRRTHGRRDNHIAKFWRDPVALAHSGGLNRSGTRRVKRIVKENRTSFPGGWSARFNN